MRKIIMFGAGRSATAAIHFFLDNALQNNWHLYLADADLNSAQQKINGNPNGTAIELDINDDPARAKVIAEAHIVISLLPSDKGVNAGIDYASRRGKPAGDLTPQEHKQAQDARAMAKKARQAARITRRLGR